jgi:hypothetical protein
MAGALWRPPMGLDLVELMMAIEDEFGLEVPDNEVGKIRTVGQLVTCVVRYRRKSEGDYEDDREAAGRARLIISEHVGIRVEQLRDDMDLFRDLWRG